jgi:hypothetical protein
MSVRWFPRFGERGEVINRLVHRPRFDSPENAIGPVTDVGTTIILLDDAVLYSRTYSTMHLPASYSSAKTEQTPSFPISPGRHSLSPSLSSSTKFDSSQEPSPSSKTGRTKPSRSPLLSASTKSRSSSKSLSFHCIREYHGGPS